MAQSDQAPNSLNHLFAQRFRACEILTASEAASGIRNSPKQRLAFNQLKNARLPSELVSSPEITKFIPLLGALHRDDVEQTKIALQILELDNEPPQRLSRFLPNYLTVIAFVYLLIFGFNAFVVMPSFENLFSEFQIRVPSMSSFFISINRVFRENVGLIVVGLVATYVLGCLPARTRSKLWDLLTRLPLIGFLFTGNDHSLRNVSKVSLITAELIDNHFPLSTALKIANGDCQSPTSTLPGEVSHGVSELSEPPQEGGAHLPQIAPPLSVSLPFSLQFLLEQSPLTTRQTDSMRDLAWIYAQRATLRTTSSLAPLTPVSIFIFGGLVGLLAVSQLLPLVSLITRLS